MAKVFVTRKISGSALPRLLNSGHDVQVSEVDRPLTPEELIEKAKGADAVLTLLTDKIDKEVLGAIGPQLKIISNYAVGFNNINIDDATAKGVVVTNTPGDDINQSVAEFAWTLMLALAKRVVEADKSTKQGAYKGWEPHIFLGGNMKGKTLGIIGMGRIGELVAKMAKGFDVKVIYHNRSRKEDVEQAMGVEYRDSLDSLVSESDFVSIHLPLTKETTHLINEESLAKFKKGAVLVNTARGQIIDEHALVDALRNGQLGGVGLDVYETEPDINPELINMENVILTPHIASATVEAREEYGNLAVNAILDALSGKMPQNIVNKEVWKV